MKVSHWSIKSKQKKPILLLLGHFLPSGSFQSRNLSWGWVMFIIFYCMTTKYFWVRDAKKDRKEESIFLAPQFPIWSIYSSFLFCWIANLLIFRYLRLSKSIWDLECPVTFPSDPSNNCYAFHNLLFFSLAVIWVIS